MNCGNNCNKYWLFYNKSIVLWLVLANRKIHLTIRNLNKKITLIYNLLI